MKQDTNGIRNNTYLVLVHTWYIPGTGCIVYTTKYKIRIVYTWYWPKMSVDVKLSSCQAVKAVCQGVWRRQDKTSPVPGVNNAHASL